MNYQTQEVLKQIDHGYRGNKKYVNVVKHKSAILLCNFLVKQQLILSYTFYQKKKFSKKRIRIKYFIHIQLLYPYLNNLISKYSAIPKSELNLIPHKPYHIMEIYSYSYGAVYTKNYVHYSELIKINKVGIFYILATFYGFKTCKEAMVLGVGGFALCKVYL
jgi:ribosomal protein S8